MQLEGAVAVITGGGSGIGRALAHRFAAEGARRVVVADLAGAEEVAGEIGGLGMRVDVSVEDEVGGLVERTEAEVGPIDLFCSNAGIAVLGGADAADEDWARSWEVNLMAHVYAARALVPRMTARGGGYLLHTASAAGLLTQLGSAPYAVTKHAAVAFAEWLAITHGHQGLRVSVLCPQGVRTPMTEPGDGGGAADVVGLDGMLEPEEVADCVVRALAEERFLVLPHPEVARYERNRAEDRERWIAGMQRLQARLLGG